MKKFEHLFSQDPIGAFEKIEEDYTRYFEVSYKISNTKINKERMDVLRADNNLSKEPYLEVLPEYSPAEGLRKMDDLVSRFSGHFGGETFAREYFEEFIAKGLMQGLMDKYIPYGHQIGMLEKAFAGIDENGNPLKYKNTVITSGTGSGKTESFMLPLLADIYKEYISSSWEPAKSHEKWFEGRIEGRSIKRQYIPNQRLNDPRPAAIRALVLYPMNALVEDQMARLREALDSNDVRAFMDNKMKGNRIYFGSYNGSTIAPKSYDLLNDPDHKKAFTKRKQEVAEQLNKIHEHFEFVNRYVATNPDKKDALYIEPRLGGDLTTSEMITRWDMQYWAPDIMITNTSMLSIMLMRRAESQMFDDTRRWLAAEDLPEAEREEAKKNRVFHIIVDELHLYRGTAGSEVACLLRMLYNAIGLEPVVDDGRGNKVPNSQIKILASSASLGEETETQKFMEEFFGIYSTIEGENVFNVQTGSNYIGKNKDVIIDYTSFSKFNHENFVAIELDTENTGKVEDVRKGKVLNFLKDKFDCDTIEDFCKKYEEQMFKDFYDCLPTNNDEAKSKRPIAQSQLIESLFAGNKEAYRGFLIFRGYIDTIYRNHKLPRFRFHKFFKYVEGLWGELNPSLSDDVPAVKNLSYNSKEVGARKVLELLRCENCGQLFIGGNRKRETNDGSVSLTLNFPNLEQIPNFNPTPMVQNKTYQDYAIFWPKDLNTPINIPAGSAIQGGGDHVVVISTGECAYSNGKAQWVPGYLDSLTGKFTPKEQSLAANTGSLKVSIKTNGIQGFLYRVVNNNNGAEIDDIRASKIYAAPCTCPHCLQDYTLRKHTNSPIRSFRTGIDRSNQILSKELLYQLDDNSAKLIGFSDSREDAAKQALGIEKEQYRDMVRMLFVECIEEIGKEVDEIELYVETEKQNCNGDFSKMIAIPSLVQSKFPNFANAVQLATDILSNKDISSYKTATIPLINLVGYGIDGILVRKLLQRGINPAGEAFRFQWYEKDPGVELYHWSTAYDFENYSLVQNPNFKDREYESQIKKQLKNAVFANSFGKYMGVSVLDAGIGYLCGPQSKDIESSNEYQTLRRLLPSDVSVYEFVDAYIRVMGDNYLYPSVEEGNAYVDYEHLKGAVKRPIKAFCESRGDEKSLGDALVRYLKKYCTDINVLSLELEKLSFTKMTNDKYMKCPKCGRVHPNKGFGFCTNTSCMEKLDPSVTVDTDSLHDHYISFDILKEKKAPRRLHTEELSGQTDDIQARLREFKNLILIDDNDPTKLGKEMTMPIDMVCVTTTMEVGVDIGSLQAIFQGNMPPTRYNYQQRVGRGGRRGQAYSTAFTFCRGRSHDVYYYEKATDEMVGGIPATPTLSLAPYKDTNGEVRMKRAIMKRVVFKEILHQAFLDLPYQYDLQDTAGEFGRIADWDNNQIVLKNWLESNEDAVNDIVHRYFDQFNTNNQIQKDIEEIIEWILTKMVGQIDFAVKKTSNQNKGLAEYLSEAGFLPMYGMPSDSRNFYHGFDSVFKRVKSVDRSSEIAISEFAPGSEKTKDKGKYRVEGLTIPMIEEANDRGKISFFDPNGDALSDRYILTYIKNIGEDDNNIKEIIEAPVGVPSHQIKLTDKQRLIVIPQAYRSLQIKGNTGTPVENNDKGGSFTQSQIFARDNSSSSAPANKKTVGNVDISVYEMGLNEDPTVWHVNSNNNRFYTGAYSANGLEMPHGKMANFMFFDKYNTNGITETSRKDQDPQNTLDIALGSKKITEMIKLELKTYPSVLNLSLETGNRSAIRAAFYSAAFMLQRALADKLDVQPDEIEICEKIDDKFEYPSLYLSDALPNGAGIVSYLYQDGKLEELIRSIVSFDSFDANKTSKEKSFMQSIISDEHRCNCLTACQKCMLTYSNRGFHHILDWRLGVGLLRLMLDENYDFGFDASHRGDFDEMADFGHIVHECARKYNLSIDASGENYWIDDNGLCTVFYHPLWKKEEVLSNIQVQYGSLRLFNTFKVLRSDLTEDKDDNITTRTTPGASRLNRLRKKNSQPTTPVNPQPPTTSDEVEDDDDDIIL